MLLGQQVQQTGTIKNFSCLIFWSFIFCPSFYTFFRNFYGPIKPRFSILYPDVLLQINVLRCMRHTAGATPVSVKMRYGMREGQRTAHLTIGTIGDKGAVPDLLTLHPRSK